MKTKNNEQETEKKEIKYIAIDSELPDEKVTDISNDLAQVIEGAKDYIETEENVEEVIVYKLVPVKRVKKEIHVLDVN